MHLRTNFEKAFGYSMDDLTPDLEGSRFTRLLERSPSMESISPSEEKLCALARSVSITNSIDPNPSAHLHFHNAYDQLREKFAEVLRKVKNTHEQQISEMQDKINELVKNLAEEKVRNKNLEEKISEQALEIDARNTAVIEILSRELLGQKKSKTQGPRSNLDSHPVSPGSPGLQHTKHETSSKTSPKEVASYSNRRVGIFSSAVPETRPVKQEHTPVVRRLPWPSL